MGIEVPDTVRRDGGKFTLVRADKGLQRPKHEALKIVPKGILALKLEKGTVKVPFLVKIPADGTGKQPAVLHFRLLQHGDELRVENPLGQIVFVLKVVVKGFAADAADLTDITDIDLFKGLGGHSFLKPCARTRFVMLESAMFSTSRPSFLQV